MNPLKQVAFPDQDRFAPPEATPMVSLVDADGVRRRDPDHPWAMDDQSLADALVKMSMIRRFDQEATAMQRKGQLSLWAPLLGQEAVQVGAQAALTRGDHVFPTHREHGIGLLMGLDMARILGVFRGAELGDWDAEEVGFHYYSMVIGAHSLHGVGYAMGVEMDLRRGLTDRRQVSLVFHGDGAISEGDVNEAYIFAVRYQAPVVFLCVNNQWAISEPVATQSRVPLYQRAWGFGMPGIRVDGNDVVGVHSVLTQAINRARQGGGPSLIEAYTHRMGAHTTADDPSRYRGADQVEYWRARDPIARVKTYLRGIGRWDEASEADLDQRLEAYGARVRQAAAQITPASLAACFEQVYVRPDPDLADQQEATRG